MYHHSKLQVSFLGRMQRYLDIFHAFGIIFEIDIICLRLCSERVQLRRCSFRNMPINHSFVHIRVFSIYPLAIHLLTRERRESR